VLLSGYGWVGVSAQAVGVQLSPFSLKAWDPARYGSLAHPGDVEGKVPNAPTLAGLPECLALLVPSASQGFEEIFAHAMWLKTWFQDRAAIALELLHRAGDDELVERVVRVADLVSLPIVAAGDVLMHVRSRKPLQDTLTATRLGKPVAECGLALEVNAEQHLRSRGRLAALYEAEWLHNQREGTSMAILLVDVDHFKLYNDTYGHQKGDSCLKAVAAALDEQVFRPSDLAARYGGEEFAVIMPNTDLDGALHVAERIRDAAHMLNLPHGASLTAECVTLSIGAAAFVPTDECRAEDLVAAADAALYRAKRQGRNRVVSTDRVEELAEA